MPFHSFIVLFLFTILGVALFVRVITFRKAKFDFFGTPPIDKFLFFSGKITLFTNWGFFIYKAIAPESGFISVSSYLSWGATILLFFGTLFMVLAIYDLGPALKVGLPDEETLLKTNRIYTFSRHPLYLGGYLITIGSCLYFPDLINISFGLFAIFIHHLIVLAEEKFLSKKFGDQWKNYREKTRRYF